ncbi:ATP synthase subunit D-domain-containing protein [Melampsora americana]|nr:ATP synthase subunit D-domain-containing protein [Melampsora americana]
MSGSGVREAVFPTRMNLNLIKQRLKGAQTGHSLLKKKVDALTKRFRTITQKIDHTKREMGRVMQLAAFSLAEVNYSSGNDISYQVQESVKEASFKVSTKQENVSGVILPTFEVDRTKGSISSEFNLTGLGRGGQQVTKAREIFAKATETLVELASLQTAFVILDEVIRMTNRRVNALEHVVIPKLENTVKYINSELDEADREDFFRLKKVQAKKKERTAIAEEENRKRNQEQGFDSDEINGTNNLLNDKDEDVIF